MSRLASRLRTILKPSPGTAWLDILMLILSGSILAVVSLGLFGTDSGESEYTCSGPGPADFGCMGGWEAVVAGILGALQIIFFVILFAVASGRLLSGIKNRADKVK